MARAASALRLSDYSLPREEKSHSAIAAPVGRRMHWRKSAEVMPAIPSPAISVIPKRRVLWSRKRFSDFGRIDILVANHGVWPAQDVAIERMSDEQWRSTLAINLDGVFGLVKHTVAQIKAQPRSGGPAGHIVLISSTSGQRGEAFHCDYSATKGAIISMVKGLSTELAASGIYVNCVAPGWVDTDMSAEAIADPKSGEAILRTIPLGRVGKPEEIAGPVLFLCTPYASFITGEVFNVNGGAVLAG